MQPTKLPLAAAGEPEEPAPAELAAADVAGEELPLFDGAELLLLPHAATTSVADTASAAVAHALCFTLPPQGLTVSKPSAWNHLG
jgi:hypothetical protein